ncbi:MAG: hypothetical protein HKN87_15425 [Saprospiraceae bacterium]|nr:hypothetical protein [Saprospiraceae bacterium]
MHKHKRTRLLIILGGLLWGIPLFSQLLLRVSTDTEDILKGLGAAFLISALFVQRKMERRVGAE